MTKNKGFEKCTEKHITAELSNNDKDIMYLRSKKPNFIVLRVDGYPGCISVHFLDGKTIVTCYPAGSNTSLEFRCPKGQTAKLERYLKNDR